MDQQGGFTTANDQAVRGKIHERLDPGAYADVVGKNWNGIGKPLVAVGIVGKGNGDVTL